MPDGIHDHVLVRSRLPARSRSGFASAKAGPRLALAALMRAAVAVVRACHQRARQRGHLRRLSDRQLADIGITRADANHEAAKPFWRD
jgi:uncharacterized protein YjiS (DUF1127 family)